MKKRLLLVCMVAICACKSHQTSSTAASDTNSTTPQADDTSFLGFTYADLAPDLRDLQPMSPPGNAVNVWEVPTKSLPTVEQLKAFVAGGKPTATGCIWTNEYDSAAKGVIAWDAASNEFVIKQKDAKCQKAQVSRLEVGDSHSNTPAPIQLPTAVYIDAWPVDENHNATSCYNNLYRMAIGSTKPYRLDVKSGAFSNSYDIVAPAIIKSNFTYGRDYKETTSDVLALDWLLIPERDIALNNFAIGPGVGLGSLKAAKLAAALAREICIFTKDGTRAQPKEVNDEILFIGAYQAAVLPKAAGGLAMPRIAALNFAFANYEKVVYSLAVNLGENRGIFLFVQGLFPNFTSKTSTESTR